MLKKIYQDGKVYCGCGTEINDREQMCALCTESYAIDDEYQRRHRRYGGIHIQGEIPANFPIRVKDRESWNTPDNAR